MTKEQHPNENDDFICVQHTAIINFKLEEEPTNDHFP